MIKAGILIKSVLINYIQYLQHPLGALLPIENHSLSIYFIDYFDNSKLYRIII